MFMNTVVSLVHKQSMKVLRKFTQISRILVGKEEQEDGQERGMYEEREEGCGLVEEKKRKEKKMRES